MAEIEKIPQSSKSLSASGKGDDGPSVFIENRISSKGGGGGTGTARAARSALLFGMTPAVAALGLYAIGSTAAWGAMLPWGLGLSDEVDRLNSVVMNLTGQVDRLEGEVDRLSFLVTNLTEQVDRYEEQNEILQESNEEFKRQNAILNASNAVYEEQNQRLNESVNELERQNEILNASNAEYAELNAELNETNQELSNEVDKLANITQNLTMVVIELEEANQNLTVQVDRLEAANENLTSQVEELEQQVLFLQEENDRLQALVDDLEAILQFIRDHAEEIQETVEAVAAFLAQEIETNRQLIMGRLELTYQQITTSWVCGYDLTFRGEPFTVDPNSPIGATDYPRAVVSQSGRDGYVEEEVLTELCLDNDDFELFLSNSTGLGTIPPVNVTSNELQVGVSVYTDLAMEWYFPSTNVTPGLNSTDWAIAEYNCNNLLPEQRFFWEPRPPSTFSPI
eukprot:CAMPEP_0197464276 /NCGR_PEP_ID=MMETSP1175-20131217/63934_1 /TAXON_ID=1003142 /ORGANISM="Triceratium dubium, Strain CCMP147" /LENGTH=453 /DNA_ID=CAMNT_0043000247 /DNA_START=197 /DNA_END=1558 /DNA_ORIENTATION=+